MHPSAREVLEICEKGSYTTPAGTTVSIATSLAESASQTRLYTPDELERLRSERVPRREALPQVAVLDATTQEAAQKYSATTTSRETDVAVLNFASARNPGGGFLGGARAQEEDLCRCSGLYPTLADQTAYFDANRRERSLLYTDHLIYSPRVPWFRVGGGQPKLETPFSASVLTAPAPNAGAIQQNQPQNLIHVEATFLRRWSNVLCVATAHGHRTLILGAWAAACSRTTRTSRRQRPATRFSHTGALWKSRSSRSPSKA